MAKVYISKVHVNDEGFLEVVLSDGKLLAGVYSETSDNWEHVTLTAYTDRGVDLPSTGEQL